MAEPHACQCTAGQRQRDTRNGDEDSGPPHPGEHTEVRFHAGPHQQHQHADEAEHRDRTAVQAVDTHDVEHGRSDQDTEDDLSDDGRHPQTFSSLGADLAGGERSVRDRGAACRDRPSRERRRSRSVASEGGCRCDHVVAQHPPSAAHRDHRVRPQGAADRHQQTVASSFAEARQPGATSKLAAADHPSTVCQQHTENRLFLLSQPIHEGVCVSIWESRTSSGHVDEPTSRRFPCRVGRVNGM